MRPASRSGRPQAPSIPEMEQLMGRCTAPLRRADEVWPGLYLGDAVIANDLEAMKEMGITHVLNAAHSSWDCKGDQVVYGQGINYYGITAEDCPDFNLSVYFHTAADFIHSAVSSPRGKVLVHCVLGRSRSATLVLAYLMIYHRFSLIDALHKVSACRPICPNRGFLKQLQDLDLDLRCRWKFCILF
ncbi:dual specificity protein phosphatase 26-like [Ambystoma mexicanum]|uniref:dual specificity protein phosphatase 26-like n=1 Tax=Ambystoma mexicanum TaxID=8296 RepID=UPI0037E7321F